MENIGLVLVAGAFFPILPSNHLIVYSFFSSIIIISMSLTKPGKILLEKDQY